jgi:SAM-dependent methyltransferase
VSFPVQTLFLLQTAIDHPGLLAVITNREIPDNSIGTGMNYSEVQVKEILNDIIFNVYSKNPVILLDLWDAGGERNYINHLHPQYETILLDFNKIFSKRDIPPRVLEISSFLGVVDIALAKIGFEAYAYDNPEFQDNANLRTLYAEYHVSPSSGRVKDIGKNGLPYPDNFFDAVILSEVLEHINFNPLPVLQEINRILKRGGVMYITTPNQANLVHRIKILTGRSIRNSVYDSVTQLDPARNTICGIHWREYTLRELIQLLETSGFSSLTSRYTLMTKDIHSPFMKFLYGAIGTMVPSFRDSITIIAEKKEYRPVNFWFHEEYLKYLSM